MDHFPNLFCPDCAAFLDPEKTVCSVHCQRPEEARFPKAGESLWRANVPGAVHSVLVVGDLAIFGYGERNGKGGVSAFQPDTGSQIWSFPTPHSVEGGLTQFGENLFFATSGFVGSGAELYCLKLDGSLVWNRDLPAGAWTKPVVDEARVHIGLDNGHVLSYDSRSGNPISHQPVTLPRGKVWLIQIDEKTLVALSKSGQIMALNSLGLRPLWTAPKDAGCEITSPPCLARGRLYFGAQGGRVLSLGVRDGDIRPFASELKGVVAAPAFSQKTLWVGAQDRSLRAFDLEKGQERKRLADFEHSITCAPYADNEFVAVCVNAYGVILLDAHTCEILWSFKVENSVRLLSEPAIAGGVVYTGTDRGSIYALPWHLGEYENAAEHLKRQKKLHQAGLYYALAARQPRPQHIREAHYQKAEECWNEIGTPEWAARMWEGLATKELKAGDAYCRAAEIQGGHNNRLAAEYFYSASRLYWRAGDVPQKVDDAARKAAQLGRWPLLRLEKRNNPKMVQGKPGEITFRASNIGHGQARELYFVLGSSLPQPVTCKVAAPLAPESYYDITLSITQTRLTDDLQIEVEYRGEQARQAPFTAKLSMLIDATPPPHKIKIGDSAFGKIRIVNPTNEPIEFEMGDSVGTEVEIDLGDGSPEARTCPECQTALHDSAKWCIHCGAKLV